MTPTTLLTHRGQYLTDLTHSDDGNDDTVGGLVNFAKCRIMYSIISKIKLYQQKGFNLQNVMQIQSFLKDPQPRCNEKEIYKRSVAIEPRGADRMAIE